MNRSIFYLIGLAALISCKNSIIQVKEIDATQIAISDSLTADQKVEAFIKPYKVNVDRQMDSILAYSPLALSKDKCPYNTAIGNMMADAVMELSDPIFFKRTGKHLDATVLNHGGIRASLPSGNVTMRSAYEIMPFENSVVVVELSGKKVDEMFNYLKQGKAHPLSGVALSLSSTGDIKEAKIHGKPVDENATYFIATNDYLQQGGDKMDFFKNPISLLELNYKIRNVLIDYFSTMDTIAPVRDNRFTKDSI